MGIFSKKHRVVGYPLLGGAITLMPREIAEAINESGNTIIVPDNGKPAGSLQEFFVAVIETALFVGNPSFKDSDRAHAMDGSLHTYHSHEVDWERINRFARMHRNGPGRLGLDGWWTHGGPGRKPVSINCFLDSDKLPRGYLNEYRDPDFPGLWMVYRP